MNKYKIFHIFLLLATMQALSAYKVRCWILCTDQTAVQNDYVEHRDYCRGYSQLRIDTDTSSPELLDAKERKSKLVALFSACMAEKGWTVPDGKYNQQASNAIPSGTSGVQKANATQTSPLSEVATPNAAPVAATVASTTLIGGKNAATRAAEQREKAFLSRSTECAFARHAAKNSSLSATRAKACDIECRERLKAAPDAPRPAACPAGGSE